MFQVMTRLMTHLLQMRFDEKKNITTTTPENVDVLTTMKFTNTQF